MYYVYMLRCEDDSLYTGITTDVNRRFSEHLNGKGAKYTKSHRPIKVESIWEVNSKVTAAKLEYRIKRCNKSQKEKLVQNKTDISTVIIDFDDIPIKRITVSENIK